MRKMLFRAGDLERARARDGEVVGVLVFEDEDPVGGETVKSLRSFQRCWCWRLWRISIASASRGDLVVAFEVKMEIAEGWRPVMLDCGSAGRTNDGPNWETRVPNRQAFCNLLDIPQNSYLWDLVDES